MCLRPLSCTAHTGERTNVFAVQARERASVARNFNLNIAEKGRKSQEKIAQFFALFITKILDKI